jgi:C4-dicarboxylate transporter DctM subunit
MLLAFFIPLFFSVPIAISLGIAAMAVILGFNLVPPSFFIQTAFLSSDSFSMLAIPFFILAGDLMLHGGISKRLVNFCTVLLGAVPGSMGLVCVLASMIFAAISGSGPATVAAIGGIMIPVMVQDGYDRSFSCTLAACSGSMGPIIPPSIAFVMYGIVAGVSIGDLFKAGILPGILMGVALMLIVIFFSKKNGYGTIHKGASARELLASFKDAILALMVPVIILGGIYSGIFSPTESAIIACDYALVLGLFIYKEIRIKDLPGIFARTALTCGTCLILVAMASCFGKVITLLGVPKMLAAAIYSISTDKIVVLLIINVLLFITGMFMETVAAILILAPLLLEVVTPLGVNPIHFGVMMVVNLVIGMCTPPVGCNLFIASRIGGIKMEKMFKWLFPMVGILLVVVLIITYIPGIALILVR